MNGRFEIESDSEDATAQSSLLLQAVGVLHHYGSMVSQQLLPGQFPVETVSGQVRVSVHAVSAANVGEGGSMNSAFSVPQTDAEKQLGVKSSSVTLPLFGGDSSGGTTSVSVISLNAALYDNPGQFNSNPLTLNIANYHCAEPPCYVEVVLQNVAPVSIAAINGEVDVEAFNVSCVEEDFTSYPHVCADGQVVNVTCNGTSAVVQTSCPYLVYSASCNALSSDGSVWSSSASGQQQQQQQHSVCTAVASTDTSTTCSCELTYNAAASPSNAEDDLSSSSAGKYSVSYVAMLSSMSTSFVDTFESAADLSATSVTGDWRVLTTIGTLAVLIISAVLIGHALDKRETSDQTAAKAADNQKQLVRWSFSRSKTEGGTAKIVAPMSSQQAKMKQRAEVKAMLLNKSKSDIAMIEESIPRVLGSQQSMGEKVAAELKQHHRWFGIYFTYSSTFPRAVRVISLATNIIIMLFIQSITYNITNPDDGSCQQATTAVECLKDKSPYATGEPKCS